MNLRKITVLSLFVLALIQPVLSKNIIVDPSVTYIDANASPYNKLLPGDTLFLKAGAWNYLAIANFKGSENAPFVFINKGGKVVFNSTIHYAITVRNCQFFKITGTGCESEFYGIAIESVEKGTGMGIGNLSSDFEIDHVSIKNVLIAGIYAKTDPDCSGKTSREFFTQYNTCIHDTYIENAGDEGMYIGNTKYFGEARRCNGRDTLIVPSLLVGVRIYNNIVVNSGWDGIQVSSADKDCKIYGNKVLFDSRDEEPNQMSGIILGGGSRCDCYNNYIADGKGIGIEVHGLGGTRVFNNVIVNPGKSYFPNDISKMKHGIYVSDVSVQPDSSFYIMNNTIVNPKSNGIKFLSVKSKQSLIASNAIINPGNFDYYENGNTKFKGVDSYIEIPDCRSSLVISNNFFARSLEEAVLAEDFSPLKESPLIDAGYPGKPFIPFDFLGKPRLPYDIPDIGAFEYQKWNRAIKPVTCSGFYNLYPNPAQTELNIEFNTAECSDCEVFISTMQGREVLREKHSVVVHRGSVLCLDVSTLASGMYICMIKCGKRVESSKLLIMNR